MTVSRKNTLNRDYRPITKYYVDQGLLKTISSSCMHYAVPYIHHYNQFDFDLKRTEPKKKKNTQPVNK